MFKKKTAVGSKSSASAKKTVAVKKAPARARPPKILFKAPEDFKPAFFEVTFATMRDGLVNGASLKVNRVRGRWDNEDAKRFDLRTYDLPTYTAIATRLGTIFAPNIAKRLPPNARFYAILRCNRKSADGSLSVILKALRQGALNKETGKVKYSKWIADKKDVVWRLVRKSTRFLPAAFVKVQLPPSVAALKAMEKAKAAAETETAEAVTRVKKPAAKKTVKKVVKKPVRKTARG